LLDNLPIEKAQNIPAGGSSAGQCPRILPEFLVAARTRFCIWRFELLIWYLRMKLKQCRFLIERLDLNVGPLIN